MKLRLSCLLLLAAVLASACAPAASGFGEIVGAAGSRPAPTSAPPSTSAAPPAPREVPTETHTGKGDGQFSTAWPADQPAFLTFECPKCSSNVFVETDGADGLLVNAIGRYKGTSWFNVSPFDQPATEITVRANAAWTATITDFRSVPELAAGKPASGKGDAVFRVAKGVTKAAFTAKGRGHVAVWVTTESSIDLLVNEIGDQQRTLDLREPAFLRIEDWDGSWTITPS
jgi:predicted small secreted protein